MNMPFFLAPMAELSHRALRELIEGFGGCDEYYSEMISASALLANGIFEKWYIDAGPKPQKLVFQLVGSESAQISRAAGFLNSLECAGIDINMGCSAPLIRKTGAGAAWMADIDRAGELIRGVRAQVKRRLSVKLRIGFKDDFEYLVRFCRRLESEGTELITLHPRLVAEKFKRRARWDYVYALKKELKIPVAGNGDIADARELSRKAALTPQASSDPKQAALTPQASSDPKQAALTPQESSDPVCDAIMVGRGAVRQPWIFAQARALTPQESSDTKETALTPQESSDLKEAALSPWTSSVPDIEATGLRFLELLARYQPPEFHISRARRFFSYFCDNLKWGNYVKNQINREENLAGIEKAWKRYFLNSIV